MQINTLGYELNFKVPCDINCIFLSVPPFYPAKDPPCVTAGLCSWGASGWIDGAGRFSLPDTGRYDISVTDGTFFSTSCLDRSSQSI